MNQWFSGLVQTWTHYACWGFGTARLFHLRLFKLELQLYLTQYRLSTCSVL
uniref:Uncharacterized protein n=1 Tax=Anguilla anguilla TaxID=7936 RepID=A0A0E9QH10_ANGAN